jgi:hypothetical protein
MQDIQMLEQLKAHRESLDLKEYQDYRVLEDYKVYKARKALLVYEDQWDHKEIKE